MRDRFFIFASAALRACAVSFSGVILGLYLSALGFNIAFMGLIITAGLMGSALATLAVIFTAGRMKRRSILVTLAFLMACGGLTFAFLTHSSFLLMIFAFMGMVNGMGRDRGASMTIEQAILPKTVKDEERTKVFAWYNVCTDSGHAVGALLGVIPAFFRSKGMGALVSYRCTWGIYSLICLISGLFVFGISKSVESEKLSLIPKLSAPSRSVITKFSLLSCLDSLGGGFLTTALISYWFFKRFGINESLLGPLFFLARLANIFSHLGAAWLAKRIGLIKTMVFTHIPSSIFLMTVPFMPTLTIAIILFLLRESLTEMDVPARQSYIVAVVKLEERVQAAGITNLTRGLAWGFAPVLAGSISAVSLSLPLLVGPSLKIIYDLLLFKEFRTIKPPEEATVV